MRASVVEGLQKMLHTHNPLVRSLKRVVENNEAPDYNVIIRANKIPRGEHARRFNAPSTSEMAVLMVNEEGANKNRDIIIRKRDGQLHKITRQTSPMMAFNILCCLSEVKMDTTLRPISGMSRESSTPTEKVSCCDFYAYPIMVRDGEDHPLQGALWPIYCGHGSQSDWVEAAIPQKQPNDSLSWKLRQD